MPYINTIDINGVIYTLANLTDGNNIVTLPELSRDDIFVLRGNIVDNTSSTSTIQPLSARQGKLLRDDLNSEIQNRINDVNLEEERATEAERVLTENLNKEIANREADVNAEETRATNAENTLTTNLNAEITRAKKAEADELARAQAAEKVLTDNLAKEVTNRTNDVNAEETRALAAEKVLTDNLSAEVTRATNRENAINTALTNEVSRAKAAESTLTSNLNTETARAKAAESANSTAISTEKSRAEGVENGLASRIATMEAFFKEADIDASQDFIDTLKEIQSYIASDKTGAAAMTASIQANATAIGETVRYTEQTLTDAEKAQARENVGAADGAELEDVRLGYNSETYSSAGGAVRAQFNALHTDLEALSQNVQALDHQITPLIVTINPDDDFANYYPSVMRSHIANGGSVYLLHEGVYIPLHYADHEQTEFVVTSGNKKTTFIVYDDKVAEKIEETIVSTDDIGDIDTALDNLQNQIDALRTLIESYHTVVEETPEEPTE